MSLDLGLIVLDTLRFDTFREEMPALRAAADHEYETTYSTARWTSPAHASLFTGYYPTEVGTHAGQKHLTTGEPALAEALGDAGLDTVALSNNVNVDTFFDFDRGFDTFHRGPGLAKRPDENATEFDWSALETKIDASGIRRPLQAITHILRSDAPLLPTLRTGLDLYLADNEDATGIDWAREPFAEAVDQPGDRFLFANFMPMHFPYAPPEEFSPLEPLDVSPMELTLREEPVTEEEHARHVENYRGAARYLDHVLPDMIESVGWDCLFVISDHGELFGEHGLRGHQYGMYEELVRVPTLAFGNLVEEGTTTAPTSLLDVHRTLLAAAGVSVPEEHRGVNLLERTPDDDRALYAESEGCEWYNPDATGVEAKIPAAWNEPHYMVRQNDATLLVDKDGTRLVDPSSGEPLDRSTADHESIVREIREGRVDLAGERTESDVPAAVSARLENLGYK